ncbi:Zn-dependent protease with chaperone function [Aciduliprofundum sp. MAR08-339]|uniref:M48 family metallopeptidase n=1 Tax=Aciduliprofundum sp. (strain MAR08-339) TaxID=673860 RepID=UPI0002A4AC72|nr:Zn-dependent protease with chaperone function [Aciduliprofundum sp. MAR08-339]
MRIRIFWLYIGILIFISLLFFVILSAPWRYVTIFSLLLLIASTIWYELPGAEKLAAKIERLRMREIDELMKRMKVKNIEIYIMDLEVVNTFQVGAKGKYIFFTKRILSILDKNEILGVLAHELAHIKLRHVMKKIFLFDVTIGAGVNGVILLPLLHLSANTELNLKVIILWGTILFYLVLRRLMWQYFEYEADCLAIKFVRKEFLISALMKINSQYSSASKKMQSFIKKRIRKIEEC